MFTRFGQNALTQSMLIIKVVLFDILLHKYFHFLNAIPICFECSSYQGFKCINQNRRWRESICYLIEHSFLGRICLLSLGEKIVQSQPHKCHVKETKFIYLQSRWARKLINISGLKEYFDLHYYIHQVCKSNTWALHRYCWLVEARRALQPWFVSLVSPTQA